jgi:hypothetical protein
MPTIKLKRSNTPGATPASLVTGEIAINEADGKLFYRNNVGAVVSLPLAQTGSGLIVMSASPTLTGTANLANASLSGTLGVGGNTTLAAASLSGLLTVNGQVQFPAAQNASAGANVLDDYEEGTWTPSVGGSATYSTQQGLYTKIGRLVHTHCNITISSIGTGSTTVISGLPFAISGSTSFVHGSVAGWFSAASSFVHVGVQGSGGGTSVTVQSATAANVTTSANAFFANGTALGFSLVYTV